MTDIYHTRRWLRLRAEKLAANPVCEYCGQAPATVVDHYSRVKAGVVDPWDMRNWRSSCWACHQSKRQHEKTGRPFTRRIIKGVDPSTGIPLDPEHWWRK